MVSYPYVCLLVCCVHIALCQKNEYGDYLQDKLSNELFPVQDEDQDYSSLYENWFMVLSNPFDLNTVTDEQLRALFILDETQINSFISYRSQHGNLLSKYELQAVPHFDSETIKKITPFITVSSTKQSWRALPARIFREKNNYFLFRVSRTLEQKKGYIKDAWGKSPYIGSPYKIYSRFRIAKANDFSFGFTFEKDEGEIFKWDIAKWSPGFDFFSLHAQVINKGKIKNIILGDYQAQFGQGITLGGGFGTGKGGETITTVRRSNLKFIPYTSVNESGFMRGAAISVEPLERVTVSGFFSHKGKDGNSVTNNTGTFLSSVSTTGLHRTISEINNKASHYEMNYGTIVEYKVGSLEAGVIFHQTRFNIGIKKTPRIYNRFDFKGNENTNIGFFTNYVWNNISFFGEIAGSINHGLAYTAGVICSVSPRVDLSIVYRKYDKNFYSFYSNSFSENTSPQNEEGCYIGGKYTAGKKISLTGYVDFFSFPWIQFRRYKPSLGTEWLLRLKFNPTKTMSFYVQAREESKAINETATSNLFLVEEGIKRNYWLNGDFSINKKLRFKLRGQYSTYTLDGTQTYGLAIIQDTYIDVGSFSLSLRCAFFDTENFENRQYVYEKNAWLTYSFPFYHGRGVRNYALIQYTLNKHLDIWFRWAITHYLNQSTIGSGEEKISGRSKNDMLIQIRVRI